MPSFKVFYLDNEKDSEDIDKAEYGASSEESPGVEH